MGVYIKGMEMPMNCYNCWLGHKCPKYEALLWNEINKERKADCPLIPVPAHGRLIDADELKALVYANIALFDSAPGRMGADQKLVRAWLASMAEDIDDAPTIIPAEEGE